MYIYICGRKWAALPVEGDLCGPPVEEEPDEETQEEEEQDQQDSHQPRYLNPVETVLTLLGRGQGRQANSLRPLIPSCQQVTGHFSTVIAQEGNYDKKETKRILKSIAKKETS